MFWRTWVFRTRGHLISLQKPSMTEEKEGIAERRKEITGMALHEDATGAPTSSISICCKWRTTTLYEVESKESYNMTIPELAASLHEMNLARYVTDQEGDTCKYITTCLVAVVDTRIFLCMINSQVRWGETCTGDVLSSSTFPKLTR